MKFSFFIAWRYLRARKSDRFISLIAIFAFLGIFLGVATLIIVTSVMNGFRHDLYQRILGMNGHASIYAYHGKPIANFIPLKNQLEQDENIITATPILQAEVLVTLKESSDGAFVKALRAEDFAQREFFANAFDGDIDTIFDEGKILIGIQMARFFGLRVGDKITLYSPFGNVTAFGTLPKLQLFEIGGIFAFDMFEYDRNFIFMDLGSAQKFFNKPERITRIELEMPNPQLILRYGDNLKEQLPQGLYHRNWFHLNGALYKAIEIERRVTYIVLTLIILIAALNIISAQIMLVNEKARSIAILRAMGARRNSIMTIFTLTGLFVGLMGTILGAIAGVLIAQNIDVLRRFVEGLLSISLFNQQLYHLEELPALLNNTQTAITVIMALLITFLAAIYPAWRAARLNPVEILRYE